MVKLTTPQPATDKINRHHYFSKHEICTNIYNFTLYYNWCKSNQSNVQIWLCPSWFQFESIAPKTTRTQNIIFNFDIFRAQIPLIWPYIEYIYECINIIYIWIQICPNLISFLSWYGHLCIHRSNLTVPKYTVVLRFRFKCAPIWIDSCIGFRRASLYSHSNLTMPKCLVYIFEFKCAPIWIDIYIAVQASLCSYSNLSGSKYYPLFIFRFKCAPIWIHICIDIIWASLYSYSNVPNTIIVPRLHRKPCIDHNCAKNGPRP